LLIDVERKESGFIIRAFRATGVNVEQCFVRGVVEGIEKSSEPPYILIYRNGILDVPSTLVANLTTRMASAGIALLVFILLGVIMLMITIIMTPILVYTTGRALRKHAVRENNVRRALGLPETPEEAPGIGGSIELVFQ